MNYQIHITKIAERDLNRAVDHIEFALKNPQAADRLLDDTEREIMSLATKELLGIYSSEQLQT